MFNVNISFLFSLILLFSVFANVVYYLLISGSWVGFLEWIVMFNVSEQKADGYLKIVENHALTSLSDRTKDGMHTSNFSILPNTILVVYFSKNWDMKNEFGRIPHFYTIRCLMKQKYFAHPKRPLLLLQIILDCREKVNHGIERFHRWEYTFHGKLIPRVELTFAHWNNSIIQVPTRLCPQELLFVA